ncbi:fumarylacetoacetate hydrolase family protein [Xanthobacter oligotrophicus]|uniref:Fumarylacetoacetate hydrolase family protein n=1 Tax=Xanthobacter oligotrophicus TaxID=2607286 RepID=A0ABW6ZWT4_9HYPH
MYYGVILNDTASLERIGPLDAAPYKGAPKAPVLYIKPANTVAADGSAVRLPAGETAAEVGASVGIVIGAPAARLDAAEALKVVAGYVLVADLSLPHTSYYRPAIREKCFDGALPVASRVVPVAEAGNPAAFVLRTFIDDAPVGERKLSDLIRDVPRLLADVTEFMTLHTGDVLLTGVEYLAPTACLGQHVRIEGGVLGTLGFTLAQETAQ